MRPDNPIWTGWSKTKRDDGTKDDGNDDGEESRRRVAARLAADRDERIEKFRREAGSQDAARRIDWVTEIIRTMSDARLVERFFLVGRRLVSCFREQSDKGTKVPTEGRYDRWACYAQESSPGSTAYFLVNKSQQRRYYGTLVTYFYAPQLRRRAIGR